MEGKILAGKILVKQHEISGVTSSGIIIPDTIKEKQYIGDVILTGADKPGEIMEVKVGDVVAFSKHSVTQVNINNVDYMLINQRDVLYISDKT